MFPLISIIVPVYNVEQHLCRCLDSLIAQTYSNTEVIIVNDGSTDTSQEICKTYVDNFKNIKLINKENQGLGLARNTGLQYAQGKYGVFIDSDDYIENNMLEEMYKEIIEHNAQVCYSGLINEYCNGRKIYGIPPKQLEYRGSEIVDYFFPTILGKVEKGQICSFAGTSVCTALYDLEIIEKYDLKFKSEREILSEDCVFNIEFCKKIERIIVVPRCYYHYCENSKSLTRKYDGTRYERIFNLYNHLENELSDNFSLAAKEYLTLFFIKNVQGVLKKLLGSQLSIKEKNKYLKEYLNNKNLASIIYKNDFKRVSIQHKILIILIKFKMRHIIYLFVIINIKLRGV